MRKLRIILLIFLTIFLLDGCAEDDSLSDATADENYIEKFNILSTEKMNIENGSEARDFIVDNENGCIYYTYTDGDYSELIKENVIGDVASKEVLAREKGFYIAYSIENDGSELLLVSIDNEVNLYVYSDNRKVNMITYDETCFEGEFPFAIGKMRENTYFMVTSKAIFEGNDKGEVKKKKECPGTDFLSASGCSEDLFCLGYINDRGENFIGLYSLEKSNIIDEQKIEFYPNFISYDKELCVVSDGNIVGVYNTENKSFHVVSELFEKGIQTSRVSGISFKKNELTVALHDKKFEPNVLNVVKMGASSGDEHDVRPYYDAQGRRIIYIYSHMSKEVVLGNMWDAIESYNYINTNYCIEFMDIKSEIDVAIDKDSQPDILFEVSPYLLQYYAEKGYLVDLWPYIDESPNISREDIMDEVETCYEMDGNLYGITDAISISGLMVSDYPEKYGDVWTVDEYLDWLEINQMRLKSMGGVNKEDLFSSCLRGNMDDYIDYETMTADFEKESFYSILNRLAALELTEESANPIWGDENIGAEMKDSVYIRFGSISRLRDIAKEEHEMGKKLKYIGYPNDGGELIGFICPIRNFAITIDSTCKEGAYDFIEYCMLRYGEKLEAGKFDDDIIFMGEFCAVKNLLEDNLVASLGTGFLGDKRSQNYLEYSINDEYVDTVKTILSSGRPDRDLDRKIRRIAWEEFETMVNGDSDAETVAKIIQSRVQILLDETK